MESLNLYDSTINKEVAIEFVFPMMSEMRYVQASEHCSIEFVLSEIRKLDSFLFQCFDEKDAVIFDDQGNAIDPLSTLKEFGECEWIQLFVT